MRTKTQLRAGKMSANHNQTLAVRSTLKAGMVEKIALNHNEPLQTRTGLKAGRRAIRRAVGAFRPVSRFERKVRKGG